MSNTIGIQVDQKTKEVVINISTGIQSILELAVANGKLTENHISTALGILNTFVENRLSAPISICNNTLSTVGDTDDN